MDLRVRYFSVLLGLVSVSCLPPSGGGARTIGTDSEAPTPPNTADPDARTPLPSVRDAEQTHQPLDRGVVRDQFVRVPDARPDMAPCPSEVCNGRDDDCDGRTDEYFPERGGTCRGQVGTCERLGTYACEGGDLQCVVEDERVGAEVCNGMDDDCDGRRDESPVDVGRECPVEIRGCERPGLTTCLEGDLVCEATNPPPAEVCNRRDDDCDGAVDEEVQEVGEECAVDIGGGLCIGLGRLACRRGELICDVDAVERPAERCNGQDDDCDDEVDEEPIGAGENCVLGVGQCARSGRMVCTEGALVCNAVPGAPRVETCNQRDDDCDGQVDEDDVCVIPDMGPPEPDAAPPPPEFELFGVHNDVNIDVLLRAGFSICYESQYNNWIEAEEVARRCPGRHIAMACVNMNEAGDVWPHDLDVVAMGRRNIVFRRTDCTPDASWVSNGVQWYASPHCSMGFAPADAPLNRARCDRGHGFSDQRVCWATNWEEGDRCGQNINLDDAGIYIRLVFDRD